MCNHTPTRPAIPVLEHDPALQAAAERAFAYYEREQKGTQTAQDLATEEALNNLHSILRSAAATAYESADQLSGSQRHLAMASMHLIELAQSQVDRLLETES